MKEVAESIWVYFVVPNHMICLTTNGIVKKDGEAVMGKGTAKQATVVMPGIAKELGKYLRAHGNVPGYLSSDSQIIIFPTKHNWWDGGELDLIRKSATWLSIEAGLNPGNVYHLPRPGCGSGRLDWETEVKPMLLLLHLPENIWIHYLPEGMKP